MIHLGTGNIFKSNPKCIIHGCNLLGIMGAGIAKTIKSFYPKCYAQYKRKCDDNLLQLGDLDIYKDKYITVINTMTQPDLKGAKWYGLKIAMNRIYKYIINNNIKEIHLPLIGSGLGRLSANVCLRLILEEFQGCPADIKVYTTFIRNESFKSFVTL